MKLPTLLQTAFAGLCLMLPSCEGLDPSLLGGGPVGGMGRGYSAGPGRYDDRGPGQGYDRGYSRPDYYREPARPQPPSYDYGLDRNDYGRYDEGDSSSSKPRDKDYFGGSKEWYKSGYALGKKDRRDRKSSDYQRHRNHYDGKTRSEFAAGYADGYSR